MYLVYTSPTLLANTFAIGTFAGYRIVEVAFTLLGTILTKCTKITFMFAFQAGIASCTCTFAICGIAGGIVLTITDTAAILSVMVGIARTITFEILPARCAETLTRFGSTFRTILTVTFVGTILAIIAIFADFFTRLSFVARSAYTSTIHRIAFCVVLAIAVQFTVGTIFQEGTRPIA